MALTLRTFEQLDGALSAHLRAQLGDDGRAEVRTFNRLFDACIDCGMSFDHDDVTGWAAERVSRFMMAA